MGSQLVISMLVGAADDSGGRLELLVLDPRNPERPERLDLRHPGGGARRFGNGQGVFLASAVGDVDGDGTREIVCGVTLGQDVCYLVAYKCLGTRWMSSPIAEFCDGSVGFIRSIAVGDIDGDGTEEIVLGTRPNGHVLLLDRVREGFVQVLIDAEAYGPGTSNTREILIADADNDGEPEILATTARTDAETWGRTPGGLFMFKRVKGAWVKTVIDDFGHRSHSRMFVVGDLRGEGRQSLVANRVGVYDRERHVVDPPSCLTRYEISASGCERTLVDTLDGAVKARGIAIGDVDEDGRNELVVGTRGLETPGYRETSLSCYRYDAEGELWGKETVATGGPLGFHCVAVGDVDGDGRGEVIASDDGMGQIAWYKRVGGVWRKRVIADYPVRIFVTRIDMISV